MRLITRAGFIDEIISDIRRSSVYICIVCG